MPNKSPELNALFSPEHVRRVVRGYNPDTGPSQTAHKRAAVAIILSPDNGRGLRALFMKRADHDLDPWSGQMAFPGGRQDPGDATLEAAARRETLEEMGLELDDSMLIGRLDDVHGGRLSAFRLSVSPYVYHCPEPGELCTNHEVADTVWIPLDFLADPGNVQDYVFPIDPMRRRFPSFVHGPYVIWGLTYRIISNFMGLFDIALPGEEPVTDVE